MFWCIHIRLVWRGRFSKWSCNSFSRKCKKQLSNVPRLNTDRRDDCTLFHTIRLPKNRYWKDFTLPRADCHAIRMPSSWIGGAIPVKQSLIRERNVIRVSFGCPSNHQQNRTRWPLMYFFGCGRGKDHHRAKFSAPVILDYQSPRKLCVHFLVCGLQWAAQSTSPSSSRCSAHVLRFGKFCSIPLRTAMRNAYQHIPDV